MPMISSIWDSMDTNYKSSASFWSFSKSEGFSVGALTETFSEAEGLSFFMWVGIEVGLYDLLLTSMRFRKAENSLLN